MKQDLYDQEKLDEMRRKLYDRSGAKQSIERHGLTDTPVDVSRNWETDMPKAEAEPAVIVEKKPRRRYRLYILIVSLLIFVFGACLLYTSDAADDVSTV